MDRNLPIIGPERVKEHIGEDCHLRISDDFTLGLKYLEWDSEFFDRPCYTLDTKSSSVPETMPKRSQLEKMANLLPPITVWAKLPPSSPQFLISALQALGAEYIETEITLRHDQKRRNLDPIPGVKIYRSDSIKGRFDIECLGNGFSLTRFHMDPRIPKEKADELWISYIKNYQISEHRHAFLVESQDIIVGVHLVHETHLEGKRVNRFDLTVLREDMRFKGLGSLLYQTAIDWCLDTGYEAVLSTQHRNVSAIQFFQKNGFSFLESAHSVFHLWT
jgi:GNAT superfamily N-acetyltransferase